MIGHKLPNKMKSATVTEPKLFHQLNNPNILPSISMHAAMPADRIGREACFYPVSWYLSVVCFSSQTLWDHQFAVGASPFLLLLLAMLQHTTALCFSCLFAYFLKKLSSFGVVVGRTRSLPPGSL
jgi:hypothetical protein